ncbi:unnamed protein product, partial [Nesidiocoris tenuis]
GQIWSTIGRPRTLAMFCSGGGPPWPIQLPFHAINDKTDERPTNPQFRGSVLFQLQIISGYYAFLKCYLYVDREIFKFLSDFKTLRGVSLICENSKYRKSGNVFSGCTVDICNFIGIIERSLSSLKYFHVLVHVKFWTRSTITDLSNRSIYLIGSLAIDPESRRHVSPPLPCSPTRRRPKDHLIGTNPRRRRRSRRSWARSSHRSSESNSIVIPYDRTDPFDRAHLASRTPVIVPLRPATIRLSCRPSDRSPLDIGPAWPPWQVARTTTGLGGSGDCTVGKIALHPRTDAGCLLRKTVPAKALGLLEDVVAGGDGSKDRPVPAASSGQVLPRPSAR